MAAFGVQRDSVRHRDFQMGRPRDFILAGIILTLLFIAMLAGIVKLILMLAGLPADNG